MSYEVTLDVVLGSNSFEGCEVILALGALPLLSFRVEEGALLVTLDVPSPPAAIPVAVHANRSLDGAVQVTAGTRDVTVHAGSRLVLVAKLAAGSDHLVEVDAFDLRPVGLAVHADAAGFYVGSSMMSRNVIRGSKIGIGLG